MNNIPSGGTVFWFQLPYVPSHNSDTVAIDMPASPSSSNQISSAANRYGNDQGDAANLVKESQTILLIDDTESLLQLQALELVAYGYEVAFFTLDAQNDCRCLAGGDRTWAY